MKYEEILQELETAIRGLEMNTEFLILFSYKKKVLKGKCSEETVKDFKEKLLNFAEQYTYDYLTTAKLLLDYNDCGM